MKKSNVLVGLFSNGRKEEIAHNRNVRDEHLCENMDVRPTQNKSGNTLV